MTPVKQTPGYGDCLRAAVASVLDLPLNHVPDCGNGGEESRWLIRLRRWATAHGLGVCSINTDGEAELPEMYNVWAVAVGPTKRNPEDDCDHAIVVLATTARGKVSLSFEHDPHASNALIESVKYLIFFTGTYSG